MIRFYAPEIERMSELAEADSGHCCRVLRLHEGDTVHVVDGMGHVFICEITDAHPRHTGLKIMEKRAEPLHWQPEITLAVAPTKNMDRVEWLAEKAVEIGVNRLVFLDCAHNVRRVVKRDRVEKIMVSAMKQSLKATLPELMEMMSLNDFVEKDTAAMKFIGYCSEDHVRKEFAREYDGVSSVSILIGPEGDFTSGEVHMAVDAGFMPVTFGDTRLRTETAALYALCATHTLISRTSLT